MNEQEYQELQGNLMEKAEHLKQRACEIEQQVSTNINELMSNTAEKLDKAAEKMHTTAAFFRNNNVSKMKEDVSTIVRKNPGRSLLGAIAIGFLLGKVLFR